MIAVIPAKTYWTFVVLISFWVLLCPKISASSKGFHWTKVLSTGRKPATIGVFLPLNLKF